MTTQKLDLSIGDYEIHAIPTGEFGLDGGAMFGTVPKVLWEKTNPSDDKNRIRMEARALLLKGKKQNILIDCGNGGDFIEKYGEKIGPKFSEIYKIEKNGASLVSSLKKYQLSPDDITTVVLTHLHFDHAGGATKAENGQIIPTFSKAKYYVQKQNYQTAIKPNIREKASYFTANFQPLLDQKCLELLDGETEILPGIHTWISNGHTLGQQMVFITDGTSSLIYCGDVVPTSSHVRLPWVMGYDINPILLIEEKTKYLNIALEKKSYLFFEHDPYCDVALIAAHGNDFQVQQKFTLS